MRTTVALGCRIFSQYTVLATQTLDAEAPERSLPWPPRSARLPHLLAIHTALYADGRASRAIAYGGAFHQRSYLRRRAAPERQALAMEAPERCLSKVWLWWRIIADGSSDSVSRSRRSARSGSRNLRPVRQGSRRAARADRVSGLFRAISPLAIARIRPRQPHIYRCKSGSTPSMSARPHPSDRRQRA
jgi:hypothetical protein